MLLLTEVKSAMALTLVKETDLAANDICYVEDMKCSCEKQITKMHLRARLALPLQLQICVSFNHQTF